MCMIHITHNPISQPSTHFQRAHSSVDPPDDGLFLFCGLRDDYTPDWRIRVCSDDFFGVDSCLNHIPYSALYSTLLAKHVVLQDGQLV